MWIVTLLVASLTVATNAQYDYADALRQSILFYEAQRSGRLPSNNRIPYRGDSALGDRGNNNEDLQGGWYDAGDNVKFGFPMAASVTLLAWGILEFEDNYQRAGQLTWARESIKWPLDYFIKAHVSDNEFYGQVGDGHIDHAYWGRPEDMTMNRPAWSITPGAPGSDLAGETAAAMAAGSMVFRNIDGSYANQLLDHARRLYNFAYNNRGKYSDSITNARDFYGSNAIEDELAWGAVWLHRATGEQDYLNKALEFYSDGTPWALSWDDKNAGVQLMLYTITNQDQYKNAVERFLRSWMPGGSVHYTPKGLAWRDQWGANRYAGNAAFVAMLADKNGIMTGEAKNWGKSQLDYMLGGHGRSLVCGFGNNPPQRPHHGSSSCPDRPASCGWNDFNQPGPNPQVLWGALVGGPGRNDEYVDDRTDYVKNEVATDYNSGFQGAVAALV